MKKSMFALSIFSILLFSSSLISLTQDIKLRVKVKKANIYINPNTDSTIIETVEEGTILTLRSLGKIKKNWYYVYYTVKQKNITKAGYILSTFVEEDTEILEPNMTGKEEKEEIKQTEEVGQNEKVEKEKERNILNSKKEEKLEINKENILQTYELTDGLINQDLQTIMDGVIKSDPRNEGIKISVEKDEAQSILFINMESLSADKSMADVFRVFLRFSEKLKDTLFKEVKLGFRKNIKFKIDGNYFQKIGKEFGTQNPVYTVRTFPENLMNPDGSKAYASWKGGMLGVVKKQMEDFNDFHKKWYFEAISEELSKTELDKSTEMEVQTNAESSSKSKEDKVGLTVEIDTSKPRNFRSTYWGMNEAQVKQVESGEFSKKEKGTQHFKGLNVLLFKDNIAGLDCFIVYYFANDKLSRARYLIAEQHSNKNLFISDFNNVKEQLIKKYGKPKKDDVIWINDLYKNDPSDYGLAVSKGDSRYIVEWDLQETEIQCVLFGDNYKVSFWIEYVGKAIKELEKKVIEEAKKDIW